MELKRVLNHDEQHLINNILLYELRGESYKLPYPDKMQKTADSLSRLGLIQPNLFGEYNLTDAGKQWWDKHIQWKKDHGQLFID